jgi:hypothetical protein
VEVSELHAKDACVGRHNGGFVSGHVFLLMVRYRRTAAVPVVLNGGLGSNMFGLAGDVGYLDLHYILQ